MSEPIAALRRDAQQMTGAAEVVEASPAEDAAALKTALAGAVGMISVPICNRYRVTGLKADECKAMGEALYGVAQAYGLLDRADPRVMAFLTLGGVTMQIIAGREKLPPEPVQDAAAQPA